MACNVCLGTGVRVGSGGERTVCECSAVPAAVVEAPKLSKK